MTWQGLRDWWRSMYKGKWDRNRLLSRKFLVTCAFFVVGFTVAYTLAVIWHISENGIVETAINAVRDVVIAWIAAQGAVDLIRGDGGGGNGTI